MSGQRYIWSGQNHSKNSPTISCLCLLNYLVVCYNTIFMETVNKVLWESFPLRAFIVTIPYSIVHLFICLFWLISKKLALFEWMT